MAGKVVRNKKWKTFLLPNMKNCSRPIEGARFPPFYDDFFLQKFNFKDLIFHSAVICGPELCKRDGMMKTRLANDIDGYPLRLVLFK